MFVMNTLLMHMIAKNTTFSFIYSRVASIQALTKMCDLCWQQKIRKNIKMKSLYVTCLLSQPVDAGKLYAVGISS